MKELKKKLKQWENLNPTDSEKFTCIFEDSEEEVKIGYLNIEGFSESNHAEYLDYDLNLLQLVFLVLSETWLTVNMSNK